MAEGRVADKLNDEEEDKKYYLQKFRLYETRSKFYMVGRDKSRALWRVLKIDRLDPSELNICEDTTVYTERECNELLKRIDEGNKFSGGLKFVTSCYGIVGFVKFLGPYYMLLITQRKKIGSICGHVVYAVNKTALISLPNSSILSKMAISRDENRYKKLLFMVDLTKDFFFSYSYHVMCSLQKNSCYGHKEQVMYETMFVWNEFLTRGIRTHLKSTLWTVALVYGFFKQAKLSVLGKDFILTLIARRSRHYAGTRYLKRGINEKGRVANDVETEQIVFEDNPEGIPTQISSIVQNRGSIPLFWAQETSRLNLKPDIVLQQKDKNYEATRLHFENLVKRYGNPVIILNLIKTHEKKPRESILRREFANAIDIINKDLPEENRLRFLHWDLSKHSRSKGLNVLAMLGKVTTYALNLTGFFYCQVTPAESSESSLKWHVISKDDTGELGSNAHLRDNNNDDDANAENVSHGDNAANSNSSVSGSEINEMCFCKPNKFQKGVLRTNCIDCIDRTNVAQYAYGLAALGHQLHSFGFISLPKIDMNDPLADDLMGLYEKMGDTLALQYGGSTAHNKIFSERRGQWKATTQSQEFFRTLQRYYSNAYMDPEKQAAINLFLGHFQPQQDKPALWELGSDQNYNPQKGGSGFAVERTRSLMKRSFSDGNVLRESNVTSRPNLGDKILPNSEMSDTTHHTGDAQDSTSDMPACGSDVSYSRYTPTPGRKIFAESVHSYFSEHGFDETTISNFLDLDWLSSTSASCEDETSERSTITGSPVGNLSTENVIGELISDTSPPLSENESGKKRKNTTDSSRSNDVAATNLDILGEFSESFAQWVINGETLCY